MSGGRAYIITYATHTRARKPQRASHVVTQPYINTVVWVTSLALRQQSYPPAILIMDKVEEMNKKAQGTKWQSNVGFVLKGIASFHARNDVNHLHSRRDNTSDP